MALFALALATACGGSSTRGGAAHGGRDGSAPAVARRRLEDRPPLVLVQRDGDPAGAVGFAVATELGSPASAAAAAALRARLVARGFDVRAEPSALGFTVTAPVSGVPEAKRFVQTIASTLEQPVAPNDPGIEAARSALQNSGAHAAGPAEASVLACSGELVAADAVKGWDAASDKGRAELSAWLRAAHTVRRSAFAAVGSKELLAAVEDALAQTPAWPDGNSLDDAWPARDELGVDFVPGASRRLSLALRISNEDAAARAARDLAAPDSVLSRRLRALRPEWRLERAAAVGRPRGACLRIDAVPRDADLGPGAPDVARALGVVSDEAQRALDPNARGYLDEAIAAAADPTDAASAAAWRALVGREKAGPPRSAVSYATAPGERSRLDLPAAIAAERQAEKEPLLELARRPEPGQGRLWALLAPTCGTSVESAMNAGEAALVVSALASTVTADDVSVEPWIAADGVGILVGTRRREPGESSTEQAMRLGRALGELVATSRPTPTDLAHARDELLRSLAGAEHRGYFVALDALTDGHPSWLEPRGTLAALGAAPSGGFEAALSRWRARPLRLAVLANGDAEQPEVLRREIERWLRPGRGQVAPCPNRNHAVAPASELTLSVSSDSSEGSYVGIPFPGFDRRLPIEARAALVLLNRSGGLLDQALADLPASATALALGGPDLGAVVIEIVAAAPQRDAAVARVRALLDRLATAKPAASDVEIARRELARGEAREPFDPRRRLIATWRGATRGEPALDAARLAAWFTALRRGSTVTVHVSTRD
jgi:hypothetical protein